MLDAEKIYDEYANLVYRYLLSLTKNPDISEELTQETFYQAIRKIKTFNGTCKVSTWLCAIAKNQWYVYQRKHPYENPIEHTNEQCEKDIESEYFSNEKKVQILKELHSLPEQMKEVMYLRIFGTLSFREIGSIMDRTENWARVTYYRGNIKLKERMKQDGNKDM